jgi:hypothetical protein
MLSRIRRSIRVSRRRVRRARRAWVRNSLDAALPPSLERRVPGWAQTTQGRLMLSVLAVVALLGWLLLLLLIAL